nr:dephospho-CoA kinase [Desulfobacteraceae bacterium]
MPGYNDKQIINAARAWNLTVSSIRRDIEISGSPQRCEFRCVVECADHDQYVMENIHGRMVDNKQTITGRLDFLTGQGLCGANPYIRAAGGKHIIQNDGCFWQMSPYIPGVRLDRPGYAFDGWRGKAMADFLISLRQTSRNMPEPLLTPPFSILEYIDTLTGRIQAREPRLFEIVTPVVRYVENYLAPVHDALPTAFCHGDFHPLNMIWSDNGIQAVIDWEFCGIKPEIYDAATLIGCMGMETTDALTGRAAMLRIGLTGGIGSGKSTVADLFAAQGVPVIDAEVIARELVEPGQTALADIVAAFGAGVLDRQGRLDRVRLRDRVFNDPRHRERLEGILHPRIHAIMAERTAAQTTPYVLLVIPLLFEAEQRDLVDRVLVVDVPVALQRARVSARDQLPPEQIDAIRALGADPIRKLVTPRVIATVLMLPLLTAMVGRCPRPACAADRVPRLSAREIGRASCRESV